MVTLQSFFSSILASFVLSALISVHGSIEPCPTSAIVHFIETTPDSLESVPKNSTWSRKNETLGCLCNLKTCVSLCCLSGMARVDGLCVEENDTTGILPRFITSIDDNGHERDIPEENFHLFTDDPCAIGWMKPSIIETFKVFENGSIYTPGFYGASISNFDQYCLMRNPNSSTYLVKVCRPWLTRGYFEICCVIVAILIMLAVFVTFTIVPELKNFHGQIFRCYVATYIGVYVMALVVQFTVEVRIHPASFAVIEFFTRYSCACSLFWLNVMSFDIWRTFRDLQPITSDSNKRRRMKFICYAIYAWCCPFIAVGSMFVSAKYVPLLREDTTSFALRQWGSVVIVGYVIIGNVFMHSWTALNIRKHKKDTANLSNGVNRHFDLAIQWFHLYLKLFVIMGFHIFVWPIWLVWPSDGTIGLMATFELVQSVSIFLIFVWKDKVKKSLRKRFFTTSVSSDSLRISTVTSHAKSTSEE